jgi:cytochrome c2
MGNKMTNQQNPTRSFRERFSLFCVDQSRRRTLAILSILACSFGLAAFSSAGPANILPAAQLIQHTSQEQSHNNAKPQEDPNLSGKSPDELAAYIFEHHHCDNCHTIGAGSKLGFNERGKEVGKGFEGCISLLTSMNVIAQVKPANRTDDEKHKVARFEQFGCTTCHQIVPGKLGLTSYGQKLKSMHMACTDVERIIAK